MVTHSRYVCGCDSDSEVPFVSVCDSSVMGRLKPVVFGNKGGQELTSSGQKGAAINDLTLCVLTPLYRSQCTDPALKSSSGPVNL